MTDPGQWTGGGDGYSPWGNPATAMLERQAQIEFQSRMDKIDRRLAAQNKQREDQSKLADQQRWAQTDRDYKAYQAKRASQGYPEQPGLADNSRWVNDSGRWNPETQTYGPGAQGNAWGDYKGSVHDMFQRSSRRAVFDADGNVVAMVPGGRASASPGTARMLEEWSTRGNQPRQPGTQIDPSQYETYGYAPGQQSPWSIPTMPTIFPQAPWNVQTQTYGEGLPRSYDQWKGANQGSIPHDLLVALMNLLYRGPQGPVPAWGEQLGYK